MQQRWRLELFHQQQHSCRSASALSRQLHNCSSPNLDVQPAPLQQPSASTSNPQFCGNNSHSIIRREFQLQQPAASNLSAISLSFNQQLNSQQQLAPAVSSRQLCNQTTRAEQRKQQQERAAGEGGDRRGFEFELFPQLLKFSQIERNLIQRLATNGSTAQRSTTKHPATSSSAAALLDLS